MSDLIGSLQGLSLCARGAARPDAQACSAAPWRAAAIARSPIFFQGTAVRTCRTEPPFLSVYSLGSFLLLIVLPAHSPLP